MTNARIWIDKNWLPGCKMKWKVMLKVEHEAKPRVVASCKTEEGARKAMERLMQRASKLYCIT